MSTAEEAHDPSGAARHLPTAWGGKRTPYLLSLPALMLFGAIVIVPLGMTVLLSFHDWGQYKGIEPVLILKNWREVLTRWWRARSAGRCCSVAIRDF